MTISLNPRIELLEKYFDFNSRYDWVTRKKIPRKNKEIDDYKSAEYFETDDLFYDPIRLDVKGVLVNYDGNHFDDIVYLLNYLQNISDDLIYEYTKEGYKVEIDTLKGSLGNLGSKALVDKIEDEIAAELFALEKLIKFVEKNKGEANENLRILFKVGKSNKDKLSIENPFLSNEVISILSKELVKEKYIKRIKELDHYRNVRRQKISDLYRKNLTSSFYNYISHELSTEETKDNICLFIGHLFKYVGLTMYEDTFRDIDDYRSKELEKTFYDGDYSEYLIQKIKSFL